VTSFLAALAEVTPVAALMAIAATWAANVSETLPPLLVGPLAGLAVLVSG